MQSFRAWPASAFCDLLLERCEAFHHAIDLHFIPGLLACTPDFLGASSVSRLATISSR